MAIDPIIKIKADNIRNKTYGKEVRESLASGIEKMSKDTVDIVNRQNDVENQFQSVLDETTHKDIISAPEIIASRISKDQTNFSNLKERLDYEYNTVTSQLAEKANKSEVTSMLGNLADAKPLFADSVIGMTNTTKLYVNTSDGMLYVHNGSNWTSTNVKYQSTGLNEGDVYPHTTTFLTTSSNLFNLETASIGYTVDGVGNLIANATFSVSDYIYGKSLGTYAHVKVVKAVAYNDSREYLGVSQVVDNKYVMPEGTGWFKIIFSKNEINNIQINEGSKLLPYERYYVKTKDIDLDVKNRDIKQGSITPDKVTFIEMATNIHTGKGKSNTSLDNSSGEEIPSVGLKSSEFMYLRAGETHFTDNFSLKTIFYDAEKKFISVNAHTPVIPSTKAIPVRAVFARYVYNDTKKIVDKRVNYGQALLPYEEYHAKVFGKKIISEDFSEDSKFVVNGSLDGTYNAGVIQGDRSISTMSSSKLHELYDDLVARFPTYVKKSTAFTNSAGTISYRYDFKATPVPTISAGQKRPKMILISGVHNEKMGAYTLYQSMKNICESWKTNDELETLRWNVDYIVIPVVNANAFDGGSRKNPNGVDIARNFPTGWFASDPEDLTYGGEFPLSELESIYIDKLLKDNRGDTVYFTSFHNFFGTEENEFNFIWNAGATQLQVDLAKTLISKMSRKWKKEYDWMPQDDNVYFGMADRNSPPGSEGLHGTSYGIQGSTFEICEVFVGEPSATKFNSLSLTLGTETFINWLIINLKYNI